VRVLGVDFGLKRIGLAVSDETALLARAWQTVPAGATPLESARALSSLLRQAREAGDEPASTIGAIVVGLPRRLNGDDNALSQPARDFAAALGDASGLSVSLQDERLSSREAESQLAVREKDWRRRKALLDAAAAAVILQDYLDDHSSRMSAARADDDSEASDT
jgi:putative Holliday junction resolvase